MPSVMVDKLIEFEVLSSNRTSYKCTRVRQFGLYPLWTSGKLREFAPSKKLLLHVEIRDDNVAYNGEAFICF